MADLRGYCCAMRARFNVAIVGINLDAPEVGSALADFVVVWEPHITIGARFCCWCGEAIKRGSPTRVEPPPGKAQP